MNLPRFSAVLGLVAVAATVAPAAERNGWPVWVGWTDEATDTRLEAWTAIGPLAFSQPLPATEAGTEPLRIGGVRPFYVAKRTDAGEVREAYSLYPLFTYRTAPGLAKWSVFNLINHTRLQAPATEAAAPPVRDERWEVWPFYFSRQTDVPADSYRALFPIAGELKQRLGYDRLSWVLFPLYGRLEKKGVVTTVTPWPFFRRIEGAGHEGWALWPLYGRREQPGVYRHRFYLWPLGYHHENQLDAAQPEEKLGVLPFYARDRRPGYQSETYVWPFFGYVDRTEPYRYHATHYFWPFWVQGRGDGRRVNRWAPFYTHSSIKGHDKTWVLWPLWRQAHWTDSRLQHRRTQVLYFLYHSTRQTSLANPAAPAAEKTHLWPLVSVWDNGAGRRQCQILSPFEVFFPHNEPVRHSYSPLFALYRYDRRSPGEVHHTLLWNLVSYRRQDERRRFHLGPLLGVETAPERGRVALLGGLFGLRRQPAAGGWRPFLFDFPRKTDQP